MIDLTLSKKMKSQYSLGYPFPHIVIDEFLPEFLVNKSLKELETYEYWGYDNLIGSRQVNKFFTPWCPENVKDIDNYAPITKSILEYLNSSEVLKFLEELTGIPNLIADDTFNGGGIHKIDSGGKLDIHADYTVHQFNGLYRRLNLLVYLNKEWDETWGGSLQLWEKDMSKSVKDIFPLFNRAVLFNTAHDSFHGHPHPLNTPNNVSRYSYALYYFTKENPNPEDLELLPYAHWKDLPNDSDIFK